MTQVIIYLLQTLVGIYGFLLLLRFTLQLSGADFYNPLAQAIVKSTKPVVSPLQALLPTTGRFSLASFIVIVLLNSILFSAIVWLLSGTLPVITQLLAWAVIAMASQLLDIFFFAILGVIILSWIAPQNRHPAAILLFQIGNPVMAPARRILPSLGGLDFSPILVIVAINVLEMAVIYPLASTFNMPSGLVWGL